MATLRDFLGSKCPDCREDILQQAPSNNRMPGAELAWCPACKATLSVEDLTRRKGKGGLGFLSRVFGKPQRG